MNYLRFALATALVALAATGVLYGQCGSAVLLETAAPAAIDGLDPLQPIAARFWEAGSAASSFGSQGCLVGCTPATSAQCVSGPDCLALSGIQWLNASCAQPGHLPSRTVFLVEQPTSDSGGRWALINVDTNTTDANTDIDAKADSICSGCASVISPYLGNGGVPSSAVLSVAGDTVMVSIGWEEATSLAQALSNGEDMVASYAVYYRTQLGPPAPMTGDPSGWTLTPDLQADGVANGGYSTDTQALVAVVIPSGDDTLAIALGLSFDGSGDPGTDPNSLSSSLLSDQAIELIDLSLLFADGFESGDTAAW